MDIAAATSQTLTVVAFTAAEHPLEQSSSSTSSASSEEDGRDVTVSWCYDFSRPLSLLPPFFDCLTLRKRLYFLSDDSAIHLLTGN